MDFKFNQDNTKNVYRALTQEEQNNFPLTFALVQYGDDICQYKKKIAKKVSEDSQDDYFII